MPRVRVEYEQLAADRWVGNAECFVLGLGARRQVFNGHSRNALEIAIRDWLDEFAPETAARRGRPPNSSKHLDVA